MSYFPILGHNRFGINRKFCFNTPLTSIWMPSSKQEQKLQTPFKNFDLTACILRCIWKARNNSAFRGEKPHVDTQLEEVKIILENYRKWSPKNRTFTLEVSSSPLKWNPSVGCDWKLNVDAYGGGCRRCYRRCPTRLAGVPHRRIHQKNWISRPSGSRSASSSH